MERVDEGLRAELLRMINGYQVSRAIQVVALLGIADLLRDGPRDSDDLAAATDTHPATLYRLLRALASVGIFREEGGHCFALTPLGDYLRSDAKESVTAWARFTSRQYHRDLWADLPHSVQTGENASQHALGMGVWEYRAQHPEESAFFDAAMTENSRLEAAAVLAAYDFGRFGCVVDVAGGQGAFLAAILAQHLAARGVLFDEPHVVARAEPVLRSAGVADRCQVVGGSFFDVVPSGGDAYVLKHILHDWDDEKALSILRGCQRAMGKTGTLLVVECVVAPPNEGAEVKFRDLLMLVGPGGKERTYEEWESLLTSAGFRLFGVTATARPVSVIEASPI